MPSKSNSSKKPAVRKKVAPKEKAIAQPKAAEPIKEVVAEAPKPKPKPKKKDAPPAKPKQILVIPVRDGDNLVCYSIPFVMNRKLDNVIFGGKLFALDGTQWNSEGRAEHWAKEVSPEGLPDLEKLGFSRG